MMMMIAMRSTPSGIVTFKDLQTLLFFFYSPQQPHKNNLTKTTTRRSFTRSSREERVGKRASVAMNKARRILAPTRRIFENKKRKKCLGFCNELGFKQVLSSLSLFCAITSSSRRHIKMASETKIREEKEEEKESSLVSTKVPKARVRFIRRVLRRSFSIRAFLFSLRVAQKTNFPPGNVDFCFPFVLL
jgi:hypothetical protein